MTFHQLIYSSGKENDAKKKRIVRNPQPKLDADRICGKRGIAQLQEIFKDFKPRGKRDFLDHYQIITTVNVISGKVNWNCNGTCPTSNNTSLFPGKGHEFDDMDLVLKKMEHWSHRLYPRLPFDSVTDRIAVLGKKVAVKTYVKRLRLDLVAPDGASAADGDEEDNAVR